MLSVTDLHARYGRIPILNGIGLEVAAGEFVGVLGHNGMGKTTLLKALMGFVPAQRGRILFDGVDVTHEPPYARARRGLGTLLGPIIGCLIMQYLATALGTQQLANTSLVFGVIFLAFVLLVPRGIVPSLRRLALRA